MPTHARRGATAAAGVLAAGVVAAALVPAGLTAGHAATTTRTAVAASPSCHLGNGVQHVINITFDNVHFFRDNPNVPSDLEQMPTLMKFLEQQRHRAVEHAHAADRPHRRGQPGDLLRPVRRPARQPVSNSYKTYKPDGSTEPDTSFAYWTSPVINNTHEGPVARS